MSMPKTAGGGVDAAVSRAMARGKSGGGSDDGAVVDPEEIIANEPDDGGEVLTVGGDDDDDDDSADAGQPASGRPSRRARRNERGWEHVNELLQQERDRAANLEGRLQALTSVVAGQPRPQQSNQPLPEDVELENLHRDMENEQIAWEAKTRGRQPTAEEYEAAKARARQIEIKKDDILARRRERVRGGAPQGLSPQQVQVMVVRQQYADLMDHPDPRVAAEFRLTHQRKTEIERKPDDAQTLAESAAEVRRKYGIGTRERRPADQRARQKYSGTAVGGGSEGGGGGPLSVKITPEIREMANLMYTGTEQERLKKWVNKNGARYLEKQRGGGSRSD